MDSVRGLVKKIRKIVAIDPGHKFEIPDKLARKVRKQFARERMAEALRQAPVRESDEVLRKKARNKRRNQRKTAEKKLARARSPAPPVRRDPPATRTISDAELARLERGEPVFIDEPVALPGGLALAGKAQP